LQQKFCSYHQPMPSKFSSIQSIRLKSTNFHEPANHQQYIPVNIRLAPDLQANTVHRHYRSYLQFRIAPIGTGTRRYSIGGRINGLHTNVK
jgi:hypothetical protein